MASLLAGALLTFLTLGLQDRVPEVVSLSVPVLLAYLSVGALLGGLGSVFSLQGFLRRW
jgi:hypothetical protein